MTNKEMTYLLKNKIYAVFTNTYLLNENKDPKLDYLKVRNLLLKLLDKDTYYYDFNNPIILEENNNNQEISDNDIIRGSIFLIKSVINELIIHTTYYPSDIKKIYLEFLNTKENQMIEKLQELKRPETKILAKVI